MKNSIKFIAALLMCLFIQNIQAQTDKNSTDKKNEIGVNLGPIVASALGSMPYNQPFGITYKRVVNKWAFRANLSYSGYRSHNYGLQSREIFHTDSTYDVRTTDWSGNAFTGRIGVEYRHRFEKGFYLVGGLDAVGIFSKYNMEVLELNYSHDSADVVGASKDTYIRTFLGSSILSQEERISKQLGIGASLGLIVPISKRWWLLGQCRFDSYFGSIEVISSDKVSGAITQSKSRSFDFRGGPLLSELSLFYRF
jgi:hypothetical protein